MKFSNRKYPWIIIGKRKSMVAIEIIMKLMTDVREVPKSNFDILYQIGFRVGY